MTIEITYELGPELGRGQSGVVYRALDRRSGRAVAVKIFRRPDEPGASEALRARLEREAALLARVRHPGVVRIVESCWEGGSARLVTELVDGESLQSLLQREARLGVERTIALVAQAARALAAAHAQAIVHRDVKPANLLVTRDGTLKITDFGVAGETGGAGADGGQYFLGTPAYVAPEQWLGKPLDGRADLYSLGVVLYRCLTGRLPHEGASVREIIHHALTREPRAPSEWLPTLPPELDGICLRSLAREPADRYPDGHALAEALEGIVVPPAPGERVAGPRIPYEGGIEESTSPQRFVRPRVPGGAARLGLAAAAVLAAAVMVELVRDPGTRSGLVAGGPAEAAAAPSVARIMPAVESLSPSHEAEELPDPAAGEVRHEALVSPAEPLLRAGTDPGARFIRWWSERIRPPVERARPQPAAATAARPEPTPARQDVVEPPPPATEPEPTRAAVLVRHGLSEGLLEVRVDGRRAALARIGAAGAAALPGEPVSALFEVEPGEHRVTVSLLSATHRVDVSTSWTARWAEGGFVARELVLSGGPGTWRLETR